MLESQNVQILSHPKHRGGNNQQSYWPELYVTKINISCQSHNIIYCIECKTCGLQNVGETMPWTLQTQGARTLQYNQKYEVKNKDSFSRVEDFNICVLYFIHMSPTGAKTKQLRLKIEQNWIHRLKLIFPNGLNLDT